MDKIKQGITTPPFLNKLQKRLLKDLMERGVWDPSQGLTSKDHRSMKCPGHIKE